MKLFSDLIENLIHATDTKSKSRLLVRYFQSEEISQNKDEALLLLIGNYPKQTISSKQLSDWSSALIDLPKWLIKRSEEEAGNFIQAFNLLLRSRDSDQESKSLSEWINDIRQLKNQDEEKIKKFLLNELTKLVESQRLILLKLITGTFKSPVSNIELVQSIGKVLKIKKENVSLRLYEILKTQSFSYDALKKEIDHENLKVPAEYPEIILITHPPDMDIDDGKWKVFGKIDGIETQIVKHGNSIHLWAKDGGIITEKFPEIVSSINKTTHDYKIFGQIIAADQGTPLDKLKSRISKKKISKKILQNEKAGFEMWENLTYDKNDTNYFLANQANFTSAKSIAFSSREELVGIHKKCRNHGFIGIYMKHNDLSNYLSWKADSFFLKAILINIEFGGFGTARIHSLTFGIYHEDKIVPVAKISEYDKKLDIEEIINYTKENTVEKFGPVRTVKPLMVYELFFDSISKSSRRKSGLLLLNPKINQKIGNEPKQSNTLDYLKRMASEL